MLDRSDWERLQEIHQEVKKLAEEADNLVRLSGDRHAYERAKAYWLGYMHAAVDGAMMGECDMEETIQTLEPGEDLDDDQFYDEANEEDLDEDGDGD